MTEMASVTDVQIEIDVVMAEEINQLRRKLCAARERADYAWRNTRTIEAARQEEMRKRDAAEAGIGVAVALEQARAHHIVQTVQALPIGGESADNPTPFHAGYQLACEEIAHRLRSEQWELGGVAAPLTPNVEFSGTPAALSPEAPLERRVGPGAQED